MRAATEDKICSLLQLQVRFTSHITTNTYCLAQNAPIPLQNVSAGKRMTRCCLQLEAKTKEVSSLQKQVAQLTLKLRDLIRWGPARHVADVLKHAVATAFDADV
jgi:hypothetical protein